MTGREPRAGRGWSSPPPPCQEGMGPRATWVEGLSPRTIPQMGTDVTPPPPADWEEQRRSQVPQQMNGRMCAWAQPPAVPHRRPRLGSRGSIGDT